jgi:hypothetical protein
MIAKYDREGSTQTETFIGGLSDEARSMWPSTVTCVKVKVRIDRRTSGQPWINTAETAFEMSGSRGKADVQKQLKTQAKTFLFCWTQDV